MTLEFTLWMMEKGYTPYFLISCFIALPLIFYFVRRLLGKNKDTEELKFLTDFDKLNKQLKDMEIISKEIDRTYNSIYADIIARKDLIIKLHDKINKLSEKEQKLNQSIEVLNDTSTKSIDYIGEVFKQLGEESEKKSAKRDTILFFLGIIFTVIFSIAFEIIKNIILNNQ